MGKPIYVLGVGLSHDGSACLLKDGEIVVAIEKERITRKKHDGMNDLDSVRYCLQTAGIRINDIDLFVQNANWGMMEAGNSWWEGPRIIPSDPSKIVTISHHLAHAYSAIGTSPFREASVLVIDGCGNAFDEVQDLEACRFPEDIPSNELRRLHFEKDSYYHFKEGRIEPIFKDFSPWGIAMRRHPMMPNSTMHSIGGVYCAASKYIFGNADDAGKLMGLAPYGRAEQYPWEIFDLTTERVLVRYHWMEHFRAPARNFDHFKANFQYYADVASWVQKQVEMAILHVVNTRHRMSPSDNLAYAGGVALNAVANRRILQETPFRHLYIQPAAADNGLAIGCAYYGWMAVLGKERKFHSGSPFLGRTYRDDEIKAAVQGYDKKISSNRSQNHFKEAARLLAEGKVLGWFQGGSEFGPRSLGNRSILADPRNPGIRDWINRRVKFREDFRPFAPAVLEDQVGNYFEWSGKSEYMLVVTKAKPEVSSLIPSVVHRDGTSRIQTVNSKWSLTFHHLLDEFAALTGIPILLNTSLNRRGMPIVETPEDALKFFLECDLDYLVIENQIMQKVPEDGNLFTPQTDEYMRI